MTKGLTSGRGSEVNRAKIGGTTTLLGDPTKKREKPYTILLFPGGHVEVARCEDGSYWVHVATKETPDCATAKITNARVDAEGRYCDETNGALQAEIDKGGVNHIAFLVSPPK